MFSGGVRATHVDEYYSRDAASWSQLARKASVQLPPPGQAVEALIEYYREGIQENELHGHHRPIEGVIWNHVHTGSWSSPLHGLPPLCKLMAYVSDVEGVMHCDLISFYVGNRTVFQSAFSSFQSLPSRSQCVSTSNNCPRSGSRPPPPVTSIRKCAEAMSSPVSLT